MMNSLAVEAIVPDAPELRRDAYSIRAVTDDAGLLALEPAWSALFAKSPAATPPLRWEWVSQWWRVYGKAYGYKGRGLTVLAVSRGPDLVGVLPLYLGRAGAGPGLRRLGFTSTGEAEFEETVAEYLDLLRDPYEGAECARAVGRALRDPAFLRWDELSLTGIPDRSPLLEEADAFAGPRFRAEVTRDRVCRISDLEGGLDAYLARISHGARADARKLLRSVERQGLALEVARTAEDADEFFAQLVDLHRRRWSAVGKAGSFAPRHAEFHGSLARLLVPRGEVVLARLRAEGRPLAVSYGHRFGDTYHCYQRGVLMEKGPLQSPGTAAFLLLARHLAGAGVVRYDHLSGTNVFKERYATDRRPLAHLRVVRPSLRFYSWRAADLARRVTNRVLRALPRPRTSPPGAEDA